MRLEIEPKHQLDPYEAVFQHEYRPLKVFQIVIIYQCSKPIKSYEFEKQPLQQIAIVKQQKWLEINPVHYTQIIWF